MRRLMVFSMLLAACAVLGVASVHADQRGVGVTPHTDVATVPIKGEYWALIIGIDQYQFVPKLQTAVRDATEVRNVLTQRYGFKPERSIMLLNEQATRDNIFRELERIGGVTGKDDSVLIYYAGHGEYDEERGLGWWVPVGGKADDRAATYITNASVRDYVRAMKAKHVYLVADSCFSGRLLGRSTPLPKSSITPEWIGRQYAKRSRWALTSGGTEPVVDGGKDGHSWFAYFFLRMLRENDAPYLLPRQIIDELGNLVANNARQTPQSAAVREADDEGGQFVFRLASASGGPVPPAKPAMPSLSAPPVKDVDVSGYDDLEKIKQLAQKREKAWEKVQGFAGEISVSKEKRLAALEKFLADFADDNPHVGKVEALRQQINAEMVVAKAPAYEAPRQAGREITGKDGAPMLLVPEGEFLYGSNNQRLSSSAFYMDKYEVTTSRYAAFLQAARRAAPARWHEASHVSNKDRPVIGVDWHDAESYCRYYGKRLPTQQEWEKAARGTDGRTYPWGNEEPTSRHANFSRTGPDNYNVLVNVGALEEGKSPYGIYDLAGNVSEWTSSSSDYDNRDRVVRGGSWLTSADWLQTTFQITWPLTFRSNDLGFRCAQAAR